MSERTLSVDGPAEVVSGESRVGEGHRQRERRRVDEHHRQHGEAADEQTDHAEQPPAGEEPSGRGDHETVEEEGDADGQCVALVGAAVQGVAEDLAEHEQASEDRHDRVQLSLEEPEARRSPGEHEQAGDVHQGIRLVATEHQDREGEPGERHRSQDTGHPRRPAVALEQEEPDGRSRAHERGRPEQQRRALPLRAAGPVDHGRDEVRRREQAGRQHGRARRTDANDPSRRRLQSRVQQAPALACSDRGVDPVRLMGRQGAVHDQGVERGVEAVLPGR